MGYTHYYRTRLDESDLDTIRRLLDLASLKFWIPLANGLGERDTFPVLEDTAHGRTLYFNGLGEDSHETMELGTETNGKRMFCKTARKPYDLIVGILIIYCCLHGTMYDVGSDGMRDEWNEYKKAYLELFPETDVSKIDAVIDTIVNS